MLKRATHGNAWPFQHMEIPLLFLVGADYLADHHGTVFQHRLNFVHGIFVAGMVLMLRTVLQFESFGLMAQQNT